MQPVPYAEEFHSPSTIFHYSNPPIHQPTRWLVDQHSAIDYILLLLLFLVYVGSNLYAQQAKLFHYVKKSVRLTNNKKSCLSIFAQVNQILDFSIEWEVMPPGAPVESRVPFARLHSRVNPQAYVVQFWTPRPCPSTVRFRPGPVSFLRLSGSQACRIATQL